MSRLRFWIFKALFRRGLEEIEREIEEEFRFHVDMKAASLTAQGMDPQEAREAALKCFGDPAGFRRAGIKQLSEARRKERRARSMGWMGKDLRDGLRQILRHPGFSLLAAGTLALGLATSTAVFTYINAYQRPFPGTDDKDLYQVSLGLEDAPYSPISYPDFLDLTEAGEGLFRTGALLQPLVAASVRHETLTEVIFGQGVTGGFFPYLGVEMSLGRGLSPADDDPAAPPAVVISHQYWIRRYARDPQVLDRTIFLNGRPYAIVGVAGPTFLGPLSSSRPQFWMPFGQFKQVYWARSDTETNRETGAAVPYLQPEPGVNPGRIREALSVVAGRLDQEAPLAERTRRFQMEPATWIHPSVRRAEEPTTRIMLLAAACLLLLACANVGNLILSAGTRRDQEMALRSAMGASRGRLVRQLLAENLLLSLLAGGMALVLAEPAARRLSSYFDRPSVWGANVPREITIDLQVLAFGFLVAVVAGIITGILPALRTSGKDVAPTLKAGGRWSSGEGGRGAGGRLLRTPDLLVSAQVAFSVVLLFVAGLVLRTLHSASDVDAGFDTRWTLASYVSTSSMGIGVEERIPFYRNLIQRFEELPWVQAATVSEQAPLSGHPAAELRAQGSEELVRATVARVFPGYFEALDMNILQGRSLVRTDTVEATAVAVVNETMARRMAGQESPVGSLLMQPGAGDSDDRVYEVVGVVQDARLTGYLRDPGPVVYFSLPQHYSAPGNALLLKVAGDPSAAVLRMEEELRAVNSRIAIVNILPYSDVVLGFLYPQRMNAELFSLIALLGLLLSAAGIFGVTSLAVARRRREIGIRLAIGAGRSSVAGLVIGRVSASLILGLVLGLGGALVATRLVERLLWGVSPTDPLSLVLEVAVLVLGVSLAVALPVRRALAIDPVGSLRVE